MLLAKSTANNLGVEIFGDRLDLECICSSLHDVIGTTGKRPCSSAAHVRVLKFCEDMEQAAQAKTQRSTLSDGIEYSSFKTLWPEAIFIVGALSGFIKFDSEDIAKKSFIYEVISSPKVIFDENIINVRFLQSRILKELERILPKQSYTRIFNLYTSGHTHFVDYATQFLDIANIEYINLAKETRLKKLSGIAQSIVGRTGEYIEVEKQVQKLAKERQCHFSQILFENLEYPENLLW